MTQIAVDQEHSITLDCEGSAEIVGHKRFSTAGIERGHHQHGMLLRFTHHEIDVAAHHSEGLVRHVAFPFGHDRTRSVDVALALAFALQECAQTMLLADLRDLAGKRYREILQIPAAAHLVVAYGDEIDDHCRYEKSHHEAYEYGHEFTRSDRSTLTVGRGDDAGVVSIEGS